MEYSLCMIGMNVFSGLPTLGKLTLRGLQLCILLVLSMAVLSCVTLKPLSFATLHGGSNSGVQQEEYRVINSEDEYGNLMEQIGMGEEPERIDFSRFMVIAVFLGEKTTGGYDIRIERILVKGETLEVHLVKRAPKEGEMVTQALTSPYHIVICPRPKGKDRVKEIDSSQVEFLNVEDN